jgi:hypothetical protein
MPVVSLKSISTTGWQEEHGCPYPVTSLADLTVLEAGSTPRGQCKKCCVMLSDPLYHAGRTGSYKAKHRCPVIAHDNHSLLHCPTACHYKQDLESASNGNKSKHGQEAKNIKATYTADLTEREG